MFCLVSSTNDRDVLTAHFVSFVATTATNRVDWLEIISATVNKD